jgi:single-strand DNA-binding protein
LTPAEAEQIQSGGVTMSDVNVVVMSGRLCAKPELRFTAKGMALCNLRLASNRIRSEKKQTTFVDARIFGKLAESVAQHRATGDAVTVTGSLQLSEWEDKESKQKRSKLYLIADEVSYGQRAHRNGDGADETATAPSKEETPVETEEIPF